MNFSLLTLCIDNFTFWKSKSKIACVIFKRCKYKANTEMKVDFFLKNQRSLVFANEDFSFILEFISFLFRRLWLMKAFLLTKLKSYILALDWPDMDFVPAHIVTISRGLSNALCVHCTLVLGYICKYLSKTNRDTHEEGCFSMLWDIKIRIFPSSDLHCIKK